MENTNESTEAARVPSPAATCSPFDNARRALVLPRRSKWFACEDRTSPDGWFGPHATFENAVMEVCCNCDYEDLRVIYVGQGHKLTNQEREDLGAEYEWEVDTANLLEVRISANAQAESRRHQP